MSEKIMEKNENMSKENNDKSTILEEEEEEEKEPQINYRGIKAMPYIIGMTTKKLLIYYLEIPRACKVNCVQLFAFFC